MLVHSYLYYERDINLVSDYQWSMWAKELAELQKKYPDDAKYVPYGELFKDWDGSSGAHLKYSPEIVGTAERLLKISGRVVTPPVISESKKVETKVKSKLKSHTRKLF